MTTNISTQVIKGIQWNILSVVVISLLQIGYTSAMARLLSVQVFGVLALASVALRFGRYFAQMGVGSAIIQKKDLSVMEIRAAFTSSLLLGMLFSLFFFLISPLLGTLLKSEDVVLIIKVLSISFLFTGISTVSTNLLRREMSFQTLSIIEMIVFLISYLGVGIPMALNNLGIWSLVAAMLTQSFLQGVLAYSVIRHSLVPIFNWQYYKPLYAFGSKISLIGFIEFLSISVDTMVIGRYMGEKILGFYNRGFMLVNLPMEYLSGAFTKVLFPAFSKIQSDTKRLRTAFLSAYSIIVYVILSISVGMAAAADNIVLVILGNKWVSVIPIFKYLAIASGIDFLSIYGGIICEAKAKLANKFKLQLTYLILFTIGLYLARNYNLEVIAIILLVAQFLRHVGYFFLIKKILLINSNEYLLSYLPGIISATLTGIIIYFSGIILKNAELSKYLIFCIQLIVGSLCLVSFLKLPLNKSLLKYVHNRLSTNNNTISPDGVRGKILQMLVKFTKS